ncbi:hypothetical protein MY04_06065 [Flammeovirga sp. MY04]|uniref:hypothetical protein n=1 Tax=Flammeovirga sp. MY04 TaxID=1191459 RepID=UPI0008266B0A|nr:hypothetical protein [Flammeovirga sp. MY04]QJD09399.1 hypothetical protein MY04_06065 [Flammeovirga sp. MY04]
MVILHEFPNIKQKAGLLIKKFLKEGLPIWYIVGDKTDINLFNAQNDLLMIKGYRGQKDKVTVAFNDDFKTFTYKKEQKKTLERMPPVEVPFGEYTVKSGNVLMYHKIGSVTTSKPFMMIGENNDVKTAVTVGTGLWQWRLHEGLLNQDDEAVDELISKVIQYLSTKTDKRRFRVNTTQSEYSDIEDVVIETEVYNDIYESIYGQTIDLVIQNDKGEKSTYTFLNSSPYFKYHLSDLSEGVYSFKASTEIEGKTEVAKGNFTVKTMELEALNPTANFDLLRNISDKTGGVFYEEATIDAFSDVLKGNKAPQKIHAEETYKELGSTFWMLIFIFVLLFSEWIIRKIYGAF